VNDEDPVIRFRARDGFHPAMKRRPDDTLPPQMIHRNSRVDAEQEALRAAARQVHLISKTEATVAGQIVTLDPHTGVLTCSCPSCEPDCRHVVAVREQALRRVQR
jgi:hypothetical protein